MFVRLKVVVYDLTNLHPLYHVGYMIAGLSLSPNVLYAMCAFGITPPFFRVKSPRE